MKHLIWGLIALAPLALPACEPGCTPLPEQRAWCELMHGYGATAVGRPGTPEGWCGPQDHQCVFARAGFPIEASDAGTCPDAGPDAAACEARP